MEELTARLSKIQDSYLGFVLGIVAYAKKNPEHIRIINEFLDSSNNITTSDVVKFVADQPDFHEYDLGSKEMAGSNVL